MKNSILLPLLLTLTFSAVADEKALSAYEAIVVSSVRSITKDIRSNLGKLYPWQNESCPSGSSESGCLVVSNSCGFAEAEYNSVTGDQINVYLRMGEWCEVRPYVFERPTALLLRKWEGAYYLINHVSVVVDGKGNSFIPPGEFISDNNLDGFYVDMVSGEGVCIDLEDLSPLYLSDIKELPHVEFNKEQMCWCNGVPVGRLTDSLR
jgi:hypothetical protein